MAADLRQRIRSGALAPGDPIPSVRDLVDEWHTSRISVGRALGLLKAEGLIESRVGARTTVVERDGRPWVSSPQDHVERVVSGATIYRENERSEIYEAGSITTANVGGAILNAIGSVVPDPSIPSEVTRVIKRARRMYQDDRLVGICTTWYAEPYIVQQRPDGPQFAERLASVDERFHGGTLGYLERLCNVEYTHTVERVAVRPAPVGVARQLGVAPGESLLWVLSTNFAGEAALQAEEWFRYPDDEGVAYRY
ncbi:GntR family transcriptional regulator [Actinomycetospora flava]|uniref:GntR family transcriptional regulator n=1 Tax=Actinomycetospora flava TaxID=3129232 RepID=A0ABU8MFK1_9PSEU